MLDWLCGKSGKAPAVRTSGANDPSQPSGGLAAQTLVATPNGWRTLETICVGDDVVTFDDGVQTVTGVRRRLHPSRPAAITGGRAPLCLPSALIGNSRPLVVAQDQTLLFESDLADTVFGDPFAVVTARQLSRLCDTRGALPEGDVTLVCLSFASEQMIFVEGNALAHCPAEDSLTSAALQTAQQANKPARYTPLPKAKAQMVVASIGIQSMHTVKPTLCASDPRRK